MTFDDWLLKTSEQKRQLIALLKHTGFYDFQYAKLIPRQPGHLTFKYPVDWQTSSLLRVRVDRFTPYWVAIHLMDYDPDFRQTVCQMVIDKAAKVYNT